MADMLLPSPSVLTGNTATLLENAVVEYKVRYILHVFIHYSC